MAGTYPQEKDLTHLALYMSRAVLFFQGQPERWNDALNEQSRVLETDGSSLFELGERWFSTMHSVLMTQPLANRLKATQEKMSKPSACPLKHYYQKMAHGAELTYYKEQFSLVERLVEMLQKHGVDALVADSFREDYLNELPEVRQNLKDLLLNEAFLPFFQTAEWLWGITGHSAASPDPLQLLAGPPRPLDIPPEVADYPALSREMLALGVATLHSRLQFLQEQWQGQSHTAKTVDGLRDKPVCGPLIKVAKRESERALTIRQPLDESIWQQGMDALERLGRQLQSSEQSQQSGTQQSGTWMLMPSTVPQWLQQVQALLQHLTDNTDWKMNDRAMAHLIQGLQQELSPHVLSHGNQTEQLLRQKKYGSAQGQRL